MSSDAIGVLVLSFSTIPWFLWLIPIFWIWVVCFLSGTNQKKPRIFGLEDSVYSLFCASIAFTKNGGVLYQLIGAPIALICYFLICLFSATMFGLYTLILSFPLSFFIDIDPLYQDGNFLKVSLISGVMVIFTTIGNVASHKEKQYKESTS